MAEQLQIYGIDPESIVDGPGLRYSLFVQGCSHRCPGCHNPESQAPEGGTFYDVEQIFADLRDHRIINRVTFSGGEPFEQPVSLAQLARLVKEAGYNLWCYSGYLYEDLLARDSATPEGAATHQLLELADVLVDGPFVQGMRSLDLKWKGSTNQRVIDLVATRAARARGENTVVLWNLAPDVSPELLKRPQSW